MDMNLVGRQIASLRRGKGLTQNDLGERLGVTFQAVSKWERGETLPDTAILLDLAEVLETSVDSILTGGSRSVGFRGRVTMGQMVEGLRCLERMGQLLGRENLLYRSAAEGINEKLNTDVELAFRDENAFEAFLAEAVIQNLLAGKYVDATDLRNSFQNDHFREIVLDHCRRYGIK